MRDELADHRADMSGVLGELNGAVRHSGTRLRRAMQYLSKMIAQRGVRIVADYLPQVSRSADYDRILKLERKLGRRPEYAAVARYTQCFAGLP